MKNRVYYGEYSLKHWIDLILKQNIILPDYQRYFVWNEKKVSTLIDTFKKKQFVPPITIGAFKIDETHLNLILDGQQRLTSVLLSYLGIYPDISTYKTSVERFASENDEELEVEELELDNIIDWNFTKLTEKGKKKSIILEKLIEGNYKKINLNVDDDFLNNTFLGFSYLVPQVSDEIQQQRYYSSVFRNINIQGEALLPQESRASLYFLDQSLVRFFNPIFCNDIKLKTKSLEFKVDFVRYLSLLAQYHHTGSANRVARGFKPRMEKYYEEYIYACINNSNSETYGTFSNIIPDKKYEELYSKLETDLKKMELPNEYPSIIDLDTYLFGIIYVYIYKKQSINIDQKETLKSDLDKIISHFKEFESHKRSPNNMGNLRKRITQSILIYERYKS